MEKLWGNTVKHLNASSLPLSPKGRFSRNVALYLPSILLASLLGTYLDLYFVGKNFYEFPVRPFPEVFSINILFTILILPSLTWVYLNLVSNMATWGRLVFTICLCALIPFVEIKSVQLGFFHIGHQWNHMYSFSGITCFLW